LYIFYTKIQQKTNLCFFSQPKLCTKEYAEHYFTTLSISSDLSPLPYKPEDFTLEDPFVREIIENGVRIISGKNLMDKGFTTGTSTGATPQYHQIELRGRRGPDSGISTTFRQAGLDERTAVQL